MRKLTLKLIFLIFLPTFLVADHNLRDVEKGCEVYKYDDYYAELECSRRVSDRRQLQRKCEAYIYDFPYGEIECSGSHFRDVERRCEVYMYSDDYGEIDC